MARPSDNSVLSAIRTRRAVRAFKSDPIPRDVLMEILEAGNWAPSGGNFQPWRFVVVEDVEMRHRLRDSAHPHWEKEFSQGPLSEQFKNLVTDIYRRCVGWDFQSFEQLRPRVAEWKDGIYYDAPVFVFVLGDGVHAPMDCPMVCLNMMLAAHSLGVGSIWVSHGLLGLKDPQMKADLGIKDQEQVYGPVLIGYPKIVPQPPEKAQPVITWI